MASPVRCFSMFSNCSRTCCSASLSVDAGLSWLGDGLLDDRLLDDRLLGVPFTCPIGLRFMVFIWMVAHTDKSDFR